MPSDDKPPKPMPSADEINAYVEASAARTKKRLTLASGNAVPLPSLEKAARKLKLTGSAAKGNPAEPASPDSPQNNAEAPRGEEAAGKGWSPFTKDGDG